MIYDNLVKNENNKVAPKNTININFVRGAFVEVK